MFSNNFKMGIRMVLLLFYIIQVFGLGLFLWFLIRITLLSPFCYLVLLHNVVIVIVKWWERKIFYAILILTHLAKENLKIVHLICNCSYNSFNYIMEMLKLSSFNNVYIFILACKKGASQLMKQNILLFVFQP